jgi:TetR/AcrR family transcriptional repressor of nem operon
MGQEQKMRRAIGIFAVMMGALQMARAVTGPALSDKMLESGVEAAMALASMG